MNDNTILQKLDEISNKIDGLDTSLSTRINDIETSLGARIDDVEISLGTRINDVETSLGARIDDVEISLGTRINDVETSLGVRIDNAEAKNSSLEVSIEILNSTVANLANDVKNINLTIENDIRTGISLALESHMNLDRKLNEILNRESNRLSEHDIMKYKINHLENEVRKLTDQPVGTA